MMNALHDGLSTNSEPTTARALPPMEVLESRLVTILRRVQEQVRCLESFAHQLDGEAMPPKEVGQDEEPRAGALPRLFHAASTIDGELGQLDAVITRIVASV